MHGDRDRAAPQPARGELRVRRARAAALRGRREAAAGAGPGPGGEGVRDRVHGRDRHAPRRPAGRPTASDPAPAPRAHAQRDYARHDGQDVRGDRRGQARRRAHHRAAHRPDPSTGGGGRALLLLAQDQPAAAPGVARDARRDHGAPRGRARRRRRRCDDRRALDPCERLRPPRRPSGACARPHDHRDARAVDGGSPRGGTSAEGARSPAVVAAPGRRAALAARPLCRDRRARAAIARFRGAHRGAARIAVQNQGRRPHSPLARRRLPGRRGVLRARTGQVGGDGRPLRRPARRRRRGLLAALPWRDWQAHRPLGARDAAADRDGRLHISRRGHALGRVVRAGLDRRRQPRDVRAAPARAGRLVRPRLPHAACIQGDARLGRRRPRVLRLAAAAQAPFLCRARRGGRAQRCRRVPRPTRRRRARGGGAAARGAAPIAVGGDTLDGDRMHPLRRDRARSGPSAAAAAVVSAGLPGDARGCRPQGAPRRGARAQLPRAQQAVGHQGAAADAAAAPVRRDREKARARPPGGPWPVQAHRRRRPRDPQGGLRDDGDAPLQVLRSARVLVLLAAPRRWTQGRRRHQAALPPHAHRPHSACARRAGRHVHARCDGRAAARHAHGDAQGECRQATGRAPQRARAIGHAGRAGPREAARRRVRRQVRRPRAHDTQERQARRAVRRCRRRGAGRRGAAVGVKAESGCGRRALRAGRWGGRTAARADGCVIARCCGRSATSRRRRRPVQGIGAQVPA
mmetsp:Transcript_29072/g.74800  ORF Transcript_29072/g.74800 Transcript_29072/m.74800 type:complete len:747 (+) Transcript_29072:1705-3945(+)